MALALTMVLAAAGCTSNDPQPEIDQGAADARALVDELADRVGTDPEVRQDDIGDPVPGDDRSGKDLIYNVHVTVADDAYRQLTDEIAPAYEAAGWTARFRGENLQLRRDDVTMGVTVFTDDGRAAVSGTGGCVR